jgi:PKHD-type hydroxylase
MTSWWQLYTGLFSARTCDFIIHEGLSLPKEPGHVGHGGKMVVDEQVRTSTVRWVPNKKPFADIYTRVQELFHEANASVFGFDLATLPKLQFTEYRARKDGRQDHYDWHEDLTWTSDKPFCRKLSFVMQLSDPALYEGGNLELKEEQPDQKNLRTRGTVIIFPSFLRHRVTPVTKGVRYSLVGWFEGPNFR